MTVDTQATALDSLAKTFGLTVVSTNGSNPNGEAAATQSSATSASSVVDELPVGSISTVKNLYAGKEDDNGRFTWSDKYPDDIEEAAENEETARHALVLRSKKCFDSRKKLELHSIIVQSPWLKKELGEHILKDYPGVTCELERLVFNAPFEPFVHRWGELVKFMKTMKQQHDEKTMEHVTLLHDVLKEELKDTIRAFEDYVAHGVITFEHLWTIFQPGAIVVSGQSGTLSACEFRSGNYGETRCGVVYGLSCESIDWSGEYFGRYEQNIEIYSFKGTQSIDKLSALPLVFHPNKVELQHVLIARGTKFEELAGYHYKAYDGIAIEWDSQRNPVRANVSGRIIIDTASFNRFSPYRARYLGDLKTSDSTAIADEETKASDDDQFLPGKKKPKIRLSEAAHLICYPRLRGYSLKLKKWLDFFIDLVTEIKFNDEAFDSLMLPSDSKELVMSFAEAQLQNEHSFDDVIQGKGRGIILLLSGPPGVGKTLTAESVAEKMHVPLYMMSAGDLGTTTDEVESQLGKILEMVVRWKAILLLDECDVFLEARSAHDLERNKLVSIFLRVLEYYEGILFLTTNRISNIDAAFQSRIHVSMAYPDLMPDARRAIWANLLQVSKMPTDMHDADLDDLCQTNLNGRQIKNVLKASQLLAIKRKSEHLTRELVDTVLAIEKRRPY